MGTLKRVDFIYSKANYTLDLNGIDWSVDAIAKKVIMMITMKKMKNFKNFSMVGKKNLMRDLNQKTILQLI